MGLMYRNKAGENSVYYGDYRPAAFEAFSVTADLISLQFNKRSCLKKYSFESSLCLPDSLSVMLESSSL
jgi:hypothetical protein